MGYKWMLAAAAACAAGPATAATYNVAPGGSDISDGISGPFRSFDRGMEALRSGDTLIIQAGSYGTGGVDLRGLSNVTVRGIGSVTIDGGGTDFGIFYRDINGVTLEGLKIQNCGLEAIYGERGRRVTIRNCEFNGNGITGVLLAWTQDVLIENVRAHHNSLQHGIYLSRGCDRAVVRNCTLYSNGYAGLQINAVSPDDLDPPTADDSTPNISTDCLVENNTIYDNGYNGAGALSLMGVQRSLIRNNLLHGNRSGGIVLYDNGQGPSYACKNNQIYHNTVVFQSGGRYGIRLVEGSTGNQITNNIFSVAGGPCLSTDEPVQSNYNCFRGTSIANGGSLSSWRSSTGNDENSIESDPGLTGDFHLAAHSAAIDGGMSLSGTSVDKDGMLRPHGANPDIGCYEFGGVAAPAPTPMPTPAPIPGTAEFKAVPGDRRVDLSWKAGTPTASSGYYVYRSMNAGTDFRPITSRLRTTSFTDRSVSNDTTYYYRLYSVTPTRNLVMAGGVVSATPTGDGGSDPPAGGGGVVYDDSLRGGWQVSLKAGRCNLAIANPVAQGTRAMGITITAAGGAVRLLGSGVSLSAKRALKLSVHGGARGGQHLSLDVIVDGEWMGAVYLADYGGTPRANGWREYTIPLGDLEISGGNLTGLIFSSPRREGAAYVDHIRAE
jgi:parallel beta helix pectate lyase-like protein